MPDFLSAINTSEPLVGIASRLLAALLLGGAVSLVYRYTRSEPASSFTSTLVLLAILIAMVTQVIGDNVARAFSLVGALSIVRFRTVVRDTEDTAYVIFAVAVGMAVGAGNYGVALTGLAIVTIAALLMRGKSVALDALPFRLEVRVGIGYDVPALLEETLDKFVATRHLVAVGTVRQGVSTEIAYRAALRSEDSAHEMVAALNRIDGVQNITLLRVTGTDD